MCCLSRTVTYSTTMNKVNATSKYLGDHYIEISITLINTFTIFGAFPTIFGSDSKIIIISAVPVHFRVCTYITSAISVKCRQLRLYLKLEF